MDRIECKHLVCQEESMGSTRHVLLQRLKSTFIKGQWNCYECRENQKQRSITLEDMQFYKRKEQTSSFGYSGEQGFYFCISCQYILCHYHCSSHSEDYGHSIIMNFHTMTIECCSCNVQLLVESVNNIHSKRFLKMLNDTMHQFSLFRSMPSLNSFHCRFCKQSIQSFYRCMECKKYIICESCFENNYHHLHRHKNEYFIKEEFPGWLIPILLKGDSVAESLMNCIHFLSARISLGIPCDNDIQWITFQQFGNRIRNIGKALSLWNVDKCYFGDIIVISTLLNYDSVVLDYACLIYGLIPIRIHHKASKEQWIEIMKQVNVKYIAVYDYEYWKSLDINTDNIEKIIIMNEKSLILEEKCLNFKNFEDSASHLSPVPIHFRKPDDVLMILCSSGSTGIPKLFTMKDEDINNQMKRTVYGSKEHPNVTAIWNYSDRINSIFQFYSGGRMLICSSTAISNIEILYKEIQLVRPTFLVGTPLFWNSVYQKYQNDCIYSKLKNPGESMNDIAQLQLKEIKQIFGNRLNSVTTGGAKISDSVLKFLQNCFTNVVDRYGSTETGGIASNGILFSHVEYKLQNWEDYKYTDYPYPRGELLIKLSDSSWHNTGDIIKLRTPKKINIIDRKQNIKKLDNGEWFNPEYIENGIISDCPSVSQIFIMIESDMIKPVALVYSNVCNSKNNEIMILNEMIEKSTLKSHQIPSHIYLIDTPFSIMDGTTTLSMKLCRRKIEMIYKEELDNLIIAAKTSQNDIQITKSDEYDLNFLIDNILPSDDDALIDSIRAVRLSNLFKSLTGSSIDPAILSGMNTTKEELYNFMKTCSSMNTLDDPLEYVDIEREYNEIDSILSGYTYPKLYNTSKDIFLTGSTGFLGCYMLHNLLLETDKNIWCLVRANSNEDATLKLYSKLQFYQCFDDLNKYSENWKSRIKIIVGSLDEKYFGMKIEDFLILNLNIDMIFHVGAVVSGLTRYHTLRNCNVGGTVEVIRLSIIGYQQNKRDSVCRINFVSSGAVFNAYPSGTIKENHELPIVPSLMYMDGYSRTKWMSDKICKRSIEKYNLPISIFRPGFISSHSFFGVGNLNDFDNRVALGIWTMKMIPNENYTMKLDQSPVDWVAKSIVKIGLDSSSIHYNFHFMNPIGSPTVSDYLKFIKTVYEQNMNQKLDEIGYKEWKENILKVESDNPIFPLTSFFADTFPSRTGYRMDMTNTKLFLEKLSLPQTITITSSIIISWLQWLFSKHKNNHRT